MPSSDLRPIKILVVEDSETDYQWLRLCLESDRVFLDHHRAKEGDEAIRFLGTNDYDLIFCDLLMPECDGFEFLERSVEARGDTPVVMLTGSQSTADEERCEELGARDFLTKPIKITAMIELMHDRMGFWVALVAEPAGLISELDSDA